MKKIMIVLLAAFCATGAHAQQDTTQRTPPLYDSTGKHKWNKPDKHSNKHKEEKNWSDSTAMPRPDTLRRKD